MLLWSLCFLNNTKYVKKRVEGLVIPLFEKINTFRFLFSTMSFRYYAASCSFSMDFSDLHKSIGSNGKCFENPI